MLEFTHETVIIASFRVIHGSQSVGSGFEALGNNHTELGCSMRCSKHVRKCVRSLRFSPARFCSLQTEDQHLEETR